MCCWWSPRSQAGSIRLKVFDTTPRAAQSAPHDLLVASQTWERPIGPQTILSKWLTLADRRLPSRGQGLTNKRWDWRGERHLFLGATQDTAVRLRYSKGVSDFATPPNGSRSRTRRKTWPTPRDSRMGARRPLADKMGYRSSDAIEDRVVARRSPRAASARRPPAVFGTHGYNPVNYCDLQWYLWPRGGSAQPGV